MKDACIGAFSEKKPMAEDGKIMKFISETQLEEIKKVHGERPEDGTIAADRPLYEVLKEAKEKKDAEFRERFKNLPPKSLDEEETDFLQAVQKHKREREREMEEEESRALTDFHMAIASRTITVKEPRPFFSSSPLSASSSAPSSSVALSPAKEKRKPELNLFPKIAVKVQAKKKKMEESMSTRDKEKGKAEEKETSHQFPRVASQDGLRLELSLSGKKSESSAVEKKGAVLHSLALYGEDSDEERVDEDEGPSEVRVDPDGSRRESLGGGLSL